MFIMIVINLSHKLIIIVTYTVKKNHGGIFEMLLTIIKNAQVTDSLIRVAIKIT